MNPASEYIRDGDAIYEKSFAIIRAEADLSRFTAEQADVAVRMIHACGVVEARLAAGNDVVCTLRDPRTPELAKTLGNTRSAVALELWRDRLAGSLVAIGNAPTALFYLLDMIAAGAPRPAAIIGMPVGFVGAAESKDALAANTLGIPYAIVRGRMGGSAMTAAAVNALARAGL
jgi:precorrin-8X/cobalt-precorrin-8 methylmutase